MMKLSREYQVLAFLLLMSVVLRFWQFQHASIEHFDEGVYASNLWFDATEGYRYPDRHLYAPPLLPALIEWNHLIWGPGPWACLSVNLLADCATVLLLWSFLRRISGPVAGLTGATLWTFHDLPILFARTALTESLLCLFMLAAVRLAEQVLSQSSRQTLTPAQTLRLAISSGFLAGLAWATKYNGWLTLAVILSATLAWGVFARFNTQNWIRTASLLGLITLVACLTWLPVLSSLQDSGGYAAVAANHRQYFVGLSGWFDSALTQLRNYWQLTSYTSLCGLALAVLWSFQKFPAPARDASDKTSLGKWMIASWWIGLGLAIPLYHPYPRLMMPWILASCLLLGVQFQWLADRRSLAETQPSRDLLKPAAFWGIAALLGLISLSGPVRPTAAWEDHRELVQITTAIIEKTGQIARSEGVPGHRVIFYVYGEPAIFYHLSAQQRLAGPIGHLDFARPEAGPPIAPTFLIVGPHAERSELFHKQWQALQDRFELIAEFPYIPSRYIQLDERHWTPDPALNIRLYRQKP